MNDGPSPVSAGMAGAPLTPHTMESRQKARQLANTKTRPTNVICDTLETTDRDPDGRQCLESQELTKDDCQNDSQNNTGDQIDLTG